VGGIVGSRLDPSASILWLTLLLEEVVEPEVLVGIYSNPHHVVEYGDGEVRQQFSVCFACRLVGGELTTSDESLEVGFSPRPRSRPCPYTSQSGCASTTTSSTDLSP